jgi:hypothetical protein
MRLRSPKLDEASMHYMLAVFDTVEQSVSAYPRLYDRYQSATLTAEDRDEALEGARATAMMHLALRRAIAAKEVDASLVGKHIPERVFTVLASLSYAFGALAEPTEPTAAALLSPAEADGLYEKFGVADWIADTRKLAPRLAADAEAR